ncbi:MAG: hypothetical protein U5K79_24445 [Cyclobacteriaceae bacterium]|nr:hypothetical protein [Cyclobacteriaceae bacterium]
MDLKKLELLVDKYFRGSTTLDEEEALKKHFSSMANADDPDSVYFRFLDHSSSKNAPGADFDEKIMSLISEKEPVPQKKNVILRYWYLAASFALLLGLGYSFRDVIIPAKQPITIAEADTWEDPQKAFEETKKALMMLSSNLNKSEEYAAEFSKFEQSQKNVKKN